MTHEHAPAGSRVAWTHLPLKGRTAAKVFLAVLLPALGCGIWLESHNLALAALAVVFVSLAISPALASTGYVLEEGGISVKHLGRTTLQPWQTFRRVIVDEDVLVVSPYKKPCFLDTFRGVYLRFNQDHETVREDALRFLLFRVPKQDGKKQDGEA